MQAIQIESRLIKRLFQSKQIEKGSHLKIIRTK